jgi:hypothetical protein
MKKYEKIIKISVFVFLLAWLGFLMAQKIDLVTADLGRHIKNGEIIISQGLRLGQPGTVLNSNYYSYTYPDYPFLNHHWASGVIFFLIYKLAGFTGLSVFNILLVAGTFAIFFYIAWRESNFTYAALFSFLLIPLMAERREIRPESFSAFFLAIFFLLFHLWSRKKISARWLAFLPLLTALWVNLHIYFFLGFFLIGVFFLVEAGSLVFSRLSDDQFQESFRKIKIIFFVGFTSTAAALVNPFGLKGLLHPLEIYHNYGYTVLEEKSVWFLENYGVMNPNFTLISGVLIFLLLGFVLLLAINRKKSGFLYFFLGIFFGTIAWTALRNFSLLGFAALPILGFVYFNIFKKRGNEFDLAREYAAGLLFISVAILGIFSNYQFVAAHSGNRGLGLAPGIEGAANFLTSEKIDGPIFNNYDIGGYLIFSLPSDKKVFVDNRPEVYPASFFTEVYEPMQIQPEIFAKVDEQYHFNSVVFYRHDITPWGMSFLKNIQENPNWTPVYEDDYAIIYLKNNEQNQSIIERYKL